MRGVARYIGMVSGSVLWFSTLQAAPLDYYRTTDLSGFLSFDGVGDATALSSGNTLPFPYYDFLGYGNVTVSKLASNSNKPGLSLSAELAARGYTYQNKYGPALLPGLSASPGIPGASDGVKLDFSLVPGGGVKRVAFNFGSLEAVTPCCVRQEMLIQYTDGSSEKVILSANGEKAGSDLTVVNRPKLIQSIVLSQLGHDAILDNVSYGSLIAKSTYSVGINPGLSSQPPRQITIIPKNSQGTDLDAQSLKGILDAADGTRRTIKIASDLRTVVQSVPASAVSNPQKAPGDYLIDRAIDKVPEGKIHDALVTLNGIAANANPVEGAVALFARGAAGALGAVSRLQTAYINDPPNEDYSSISTRDGTTVSLGFSARYGARYQAADDYFNKMSYAIESGELALLSIEKAEAAQLHGDVSSRDLQLAVATAYLQSSDLAYEDAFSALTIVKGVFEADGLLTTQFDTTPLKLAQNYISDNGISAETRNTMLRFGITNDDIDSIVNQFLAENVTDNLNSTLIFQDVFSMSEDIVSHSTIDSLIGIQNNVSDIKEPDSFILIATLMIFLVLIRERLKTICLH